MIKFLKRLVAGSEIDELERWRMLTVQYYVALSEHSADVVLVLRNLEGAAQGMEVKSVWDLKSFLGQAKKGPG
jgi:hypothetical protein